MGSSFKVGDRVRDRVTGFTGVVTQRVEYLHGSPRCCVSRTSLWEGKTVAEWFEEGSLEVDE